METLPCRIPTTDRTVVLRYAGPAGEDLPDLSTLSVVRLVGHEAMGELFEYTLTVRTAEVPDGPPRMPPGFDRSALEGRALSLAIEQDDARLRSLSALVTRIDGPTVEARHFLLTLTLRPTLWLATQHADYRLFQHQSVVDVINTLLARYALTLEWRLDTARHAPRELLVQYGETDFDFFQRLTQTWGIHWFIEHHPDGHRLVLCDRLTSFRPCPDTACRSLTWFPPGHRAGDARLAALQVCSTLVPDGWRGTDYDFSRPGADTDVERCHAPARHARLPREWPGGYMQPASEHPWRDEGEHLARLRSETLRQGRYRLHGHGSLRGLLCGHTLTLHQYPEAEANGPYLVYATTLQLEDVPERTGTPRHWQCRVTFCAQPLDTPLLPERTVAKPRTHGPQTATVTGPAGHELWTDTYGRIRIQFHWDRQGQHDEHSTGWVRVASHAAGAQFGAIHLPRVGQEVVVDFLNGDPDTPLVVGVVANATHGPPWRLPAQHALSGYRSRELAGQRHNTLVWDDTAGEIQMQLGSDHGGSQLSLGYLRRIADHDGRREACGEGFELRTAHWGAIRAARGLLLSAEAQGAGPQLARDGLRQSLGEALRVARELGQTASAHQGLAADSTAQAALAHAIETLDAGANYRPGPPGDGAALIAAHAPAGIAWAAGTSLSACAGQHVDLVAQHHLQASAGQQAIVNAGQGIGLFAHSGELRAIAHQGNAVLQAQRADIELNARRDVTLTASQGDITLHAGRTLTLMTDDGTGIRIGHGRVEVFGPSGVTLHTGAFGVTGPATLQGALPRFGHSDSGRFFRLTRLTDQTPRANTRYRITKKDGSVIEGVSGDDGETSLLASEHIDIVDIAFDEIDLS